MFSHTLSFLHRSCVVSCAIIFIATVSGSVFAQQSKITIDGFPPIPEQPQRFALQPQPQQQLPQHPQQSQEDKARLIAQSFGPGTRSNEQTQNPALPGDVPEDQRRSGVWSMESHLNLQTRNQTWQTPEPTLPAQKPVTQPYYESPKTNQNDFIPIKPAIRQVSGRETESESPFVVQPITAIPQDSPPPITPPSNNTPLPEVSDSTQWSGDAGNQESGFRDQESDVGLRASDFGDQESDVGLLESETDTNPEAATRPLPPRGAQKEKSAEDGNNSPFAFLPTSAGPTMTVVSSLAIVLGVFFAFVWLMKRATPRQGGLLPTEVFEKLGSVPLSPKMHLNLFRLGGKLVLVSVTPDGMEPVAEVTDPDEVIHLIGLCKQNDPRSASAAFRQVLKQYTGEKGPQMQVPPAQQYSQMAMQQQMQQMQPMSGGFTPQQMQHYPAQQYQQQTMRKPVGMARR